MSVDAPIVVAFACHNCFTTMKAPAHLSGRKAKCRGCGQGVLIPPPSEDEEYEVEVKAAAPPLPPIVRGDPDETTAESSSIAASPAILTMPREPWYYRFLATYALVVAALGVGQFALAVLGIAGGLSMGTITGWLAALVAGYSVVALLASLCFAAPVLLGVDAARNLRVMRYLQQHR